MCWSSQLIKLLIRPIYWRNRDRQNTQNQFSEKYDVKIRGTEVARDSSSNLSKPETLY